MIGIKKTYIVVALMLLSFFAASGFDCRAAKAGDNRPHIFMIATVDSPKGYVGEWKTLTVTLYSDSENIADISPLGRPNFGELAIYDMGGDKRLSKTTYKGKEYWSVVAARWCVCAENPGKYSIRIPDFSIGVASYRIVDSFWGRKRVQTVKEYPVSVDDVSIRVVAVPAPPDGFLFSGAVGKFDLDVWIPEGDIVKDEDAVAMVSVSGVGSLHSVSIPKVVDAFPSRQLRLKEVNEDRKNFIKENSLNSEIELECSFVPLQEGELEIGVVKFGYFDTSSGKYRYAESLPVKFSVLGSSTPSSSSPPVIIGI